MTAPQEVKAGIGLQGKNLLDVSHPGMYCLPGGELSRSYFKAANWGLSPGFQWQFHIGAIVAKNLPTCCGICSGSEGKEWTDMAYPLQMPEGAYHTITAPDYCAWPNLTLLPNGEIAAVVHNKPSHAGMEADVELWVSSDAGDTWAQRSQITHHQPNTIRMNVAAGLNSKGELIVLCAGHNRDPETGALLQMPFATICCVSGDNGYSWEETSEAPPPPGLARATPFGDIVINGDELLVGYYTGKKEEGKLPISSCHVLRSVDDGRTWEYLATIAEQFSETPLFKAPDGTFLAAARNAWGPTARADIPGSNSEPALVLHTSQDQGRTWQQRYYLSNPLQHPAHFLQLADGRILLTFGSRLEELYGVVGRLSDDNGGTWSRPFTLIGGLMHRDCGYPSSVQLANGEIVTAYYARSAPWYQRYHMGVLRWRPAMVKVKMGSVWGQEREDRD